MRRLGFLVVLGATPTFGQTVYHWAGGASGAWTDASRWTPNGVPGAAA